MSLIRTQRRKQSLRQVAEIVEDRILTCLTGGNNPKQKQAFSKLLRDGRLENQIITVDVPHKDASPETFRDQSDIITSIKKLVGAKKVVRADMTIAQARPLLEVSPLATTFETRY